MMMVVMAAVITTLFFTSQWRQTSERDSRTISDFYHKTVNAMDHKRGSGGAQIVMGGKGQSVVNEAKDKDGDGTVDEDDEKVAEAMAERLRAAEQRAKDLANAKAPLKPDAPSEVVGIGSSAGGQNKKKGKITSEEQEDDSEEYHEVTVTLNAMLEKSPFVIFSKTYCPYSKRAKGILLDKYSIEPAPFVVELDEEPLGKQLQAKLGELTGRKTVPNIIINGKSIGGGDEVAELDTRKTLIDKVKSMGGKRVSMKERFAKNGKKRE